MKQRVWASFIVILFLAGATVSVRAQQVDQRLTAIRAQVAEVDRTIAESEGHGEYSSIFRNELVLNRFGNPWPAVGIYQKTVRFYYTYGDREVDPYPSRLLRITVTTKRSDRREYSEYVFDPAGALVFALESEGENAADARRFYFAGGRLVAATSGNHGARVPTRETKEGVAIVLSEKRKLVEIFRNSLE